MSSARTVTESTFRTRHTCSAAIQRPEKSPGLRSATARTPSA